MHWTSPVWTWPLLLVCATGAVLWTIRAYNETVPEVSSRLQRVLVGLRVTIFLLLLTALAGPVVDRRWSDLRPAELVVVVEDSGSMGLNDSDVAGADSRWQQALAEVAALDSALSASDVSVRVVALRGNGIGATRQFGPQDLVIEAPTARGTNLAALLRRTGERMVGHPVRATVVFSDGQETVPQVTGSGGGGLAETPGLFVVGMGDPQGPADRILKDVRYPETVYVGDRVVLEFAVDHRLPAEGVRQEGVRQMTVRLVGPSGVVAEKVLTSAERFVPGTLEFIPDKEGLQTYELTVDLLDNERYPANNSASMAIDVRKERSQVLLLSSVPSWDVRFVAQAANFEDRIDLSVVYPGPVGLVYADSLVRWVAPQGTAEWSRWDAVVLVGWSGPLADLDWAGLGDAVARGVGLLVIAAGDSHEGSAHAVAAPPPELTAILPVQVSRWRWLQGPYFTRVTLAGQGHPVLGGVGSGRLPLPPITRLAVVQARRDAMVILHGQLEKDKSRDLLVVGTTGSGRVAWFGATQLWRLAFWERSTSGPDREQVGRRLVRNLLVWTASGNVDAGPVFTGGQRDYQTGEPIGLTAKWLDMRGGPVTDRLLSVVVRHTADSSEPSSGEVRAGKSYALQMSPAGDGTAVVELPPLPAGRYTVQLVGAGDPPVMGRTENLVVGDGRLELTQVRMNERRLRQLAAAGGRHLYYAQSMDDRRALLRDLLAVDWHGEQVVQRHRFDLRLMWPLLALVAGLLGCEWYLRRRHGLL